MAKFGEPVSAPSSPADRPASLRYLAAAVSGGVAVLYLVLMRLVADAEADEPENTYGAYLFLALTYVVGAVLLVIVNRRAVWVIGAVVQVLVIVLFVMFGAGAFGPGQGVFDYEALNDLPMEWWAATITVSELVLLGLLCYLALASGDTRAPARSSAPQ